MYLNEVQNPIVFLDLLFESSHEEGKYSQQDIRDEINTMIIAVILIYYIFYKVGLLNKIEEKYLFFFQGSDTTTTTISFVFLMLASFPDIQVRTYHIYLIICNYLYNENYFHIDFLLSFSHFLSQRTKYTRN